MYIEHVGTMSVKNYSNGMICPVEFSAAGWGNAGRHEVVGKVWLDEAAKKSHAAPVAPALATDAAPAPTTTPAAPAAPAHAGKDAAKK